MNRLKRLIVEIHRRSLWQVLMVYLGACWAVLEASDQVIDRYLLPEWVYPTEIIVLLVGLPLVLGTAMVREEASKPSLAGSSVESDRAAAEEAAAKPKAEPPEGGHAEEERRYRARGAGSLARYLTWPRAVMAVLGALVAVGVASAFVLYRGAGRVTESSGAAGDAFEERAWLVVAQFEAAEEDEEVALAARELLAVDLQQSRYVNVYSREQLASVLQRMGPIRRASIAS